MLKIVLFIITFFATLFTLPNEVKWSRSIEHHAVCQSLYKKAKTDLERNINKYTLQKLSYKDFYSSLKKGEELSVKTIECSKKECLGTYKNGEMFYFKLRLNQFFISQLDSNGIDFIFNKNLSIEKEFAQNEKFAIIMDLDETVLDNSEYQVQLFKRNETFNQESWSDWVNKEEATLIPGAKEFIDFARNQNIQIIFISNRMHSNLIATINNLKALEVSDESDIFLLRIDKADKKTKRREEIYQSKNRMSNYPKFKIIAYFGDQYGDFPLIDPSQEWPENYYMFPNPMYGKWARD